MIHQALTQQARGIMETAGIVAVLRLQKQPEACDGGRAHHDQLSFEQALFATGAIHHNDGSGFVLPGMQQQIHSHTTAEHFHPACGQGSPQR